MLLSLNAIDEQGNIREFYTQFDNLEMGFDFLTYVITQGHILVEVYMLDGNSWIPLPLKAFDGQPISPVLRQLEQQWEYILTNPV